MTLLGRGDALIVVDVQNDFLPGGSLGVPRGDEILTPLNDALNEASLRDVPIVATRDWHPPRHCSFREQGGPWPVHCVAGSFGAAFAIDLRLTPATLTVSKGIRPDRDAYSGFDGTDLDQRLRSLGVERVVIGGLATELCVASTARDAVRLGYGAAILMDAIRAIDLHPGDGARAVDAMVKEGVRPIAQSGATVVGRL